jgi:hypothetical protein
MSVIALALNLPKIAKAGLFPDFFKTLLDRRPFASSGIDTIINGFLRNPGQIDGYDILPTSDD